MLKCGQAAFNQHIPGWVCYLQTGAGQPKSQKRFFGPWRTDLVWKIVKKRSEVLRSEVGFTLFVLRFAQLVLLKLSYSAADRQDGTLKTLVKNQFGSHPFGLGGRVRNTLEET